MADSLPTSEPPKKRGRGRPESVPTTEVIDRVCAAIREGNYREVGAAIAGVPNRTFFRWCKRGKQELEGPFHDFWHAILEAESAAEIRMLETVWKAALQDPMHARWFLQRKFPERWGANRGDIRALAKQLRALKVPHVGPDPVDAPRSEAATPAAREQLRHGEGCGSPLPDEPTILDDRSGV